MGIIEKVTGASRQLLVSSAAEDARPQLAHYPRQVVFHHQPKTAGSSFRTYLHTLFHPQQICPAEIDDELIALHDDERVEFRLFAGHFRFDTIEEFFPDADWIIFLRHPVERVISNYYNLRDPARHPKDWKERSAQRPKVQAFLDEVREMSLKQFVSSDHPRARDRIVNRQTRYLLPRRGNGPGRSPVVWDEAMLEQAKETLSERFRFVGVQEHYRVSMQVFCRTFGVSAPEDLDQFDRNINEFRGSDDRYEVGLDIRTYLEEQNLMDIELWKYATALLSARTESLGLPPVQGGMVSS